MFLRTLVRRFVLPVVAALVPAGAFAAPAAYVDFSPTAAVYGDPVQLSVSVSDGSTANMTNVQMASGVFTFPAGVTTSLTQAPYTTCTGATVTSAPGSNTLSFSAPNVPWFGCGFYVYVDFAGPGTYTATLPPNAVTTDQGTAISSLSGTVTITAPLLVTNVNDSGVGSLRDAIATANANCSAGPQRIEFNIDVAGAAVIEPLSALPALTCGDVTIDGYTQPLTSPNAGPMGCVQPVVRVELSGAKCGSGCNGIELAAFGQALRGLAVHSWSGTGIAAG